MSAEKAALLDFDVGARVYCADEEACGRLHKVVVNPHTREVTDLIVERGFLRKQERVLPVAMVERAAEDGIYTSMDMDGLSNLPEYREIEFEEPEGDWGKPHQGNMVCWSSPHGPMCHEAVVPRVRREVQEGIQSNRDVLERGTPVINSDGEMGQVDHVLVDSTTGEIAYLVVRRGLLPDFPIIPTGMIKQVGEKGIYVTPSDDEIDELPQYAPRSASRVRSELEARLASAEFDLSEVSFTFENGIVQLVGQVENGPARQHAEAIARSVEGVIDVEENLSVGSTSAAL